MPELIQNHDMLKTIGKGIFGFTPGVSYFAFLGVAQPDVTFAISVIVGVLSAMVAGVTFISICMDIERKNRVRKQEEERERLNLPSNK